MPRPDDALKMGFGGAALALMLLVPGNPTTPALREESLVYVFDHVARSPDAPLPTILIVAPDGAGPSGEAPPGAAHIDWRTPFVGTALALGCGAGSACPAFRASDAPPGPRLGSRGNDTARLSIYVFDDEGLLLASNAAPADRARFSQAASYRTIPDAWWYLGSGPTPAGTRLIPSVAAAALDACWPTLVLLPVGGVATCDADSPLGHMFLTVRVEALRA